MRKNQGQGLRLPSQELTGINLSPRAGPVRILPPNPTPTPCSTRSFRRSVTGHVHSSPPIPSLTLECLPRVSTKLTPDLGSRKLEDGTQPKGSHRRTCTRNHIHQILPRAILSGPHLPRPSCLRRSGRGQTRGHFETTYSPGNPSRVELLPSTRKVGR